MGETAVPPPAGRRLATDWMMQREDEALPATFPWQSLAPSFTNRRRGEWAKRRGRSVLHRRAAFHRRDAECAGNDSGFGQETRSLMDVSSRRVSLKMLRQAQVVIWFCSMWHQTSP